MKIISQYRSVFFILAGALSHTRFMMQSIYSVKIALPEDQIRFFIMEDKEKIRKMANYVALFHAYFFIKSVIPSKSLATQMEFVTKMITFQEVSPEVSKLVLKSTLSHLWHLDQVNIFLSCR